MNAPLVEGTHLSPACHIFQHRRFRPDTEVKAVTVYVLPSSKAVSAFPAKKITVNSAGQSQKNPAVSICLLRHSAASGQINPESSCNMSLLENWHCPACCVPCAARWPEGNGREWRLAVICLAGRDMPNRLPRHARYRGLRARLLG